MVEVVDTLKGTECSRLENPMIKKYATRQLGNSLTRGAFYFFPLTFYFLTPSILPSTLQPKGRILSLLLLLITSQFNHPVWISSLVGPCWSIESNKHSFYTYMFLNALRAFRRTKAKFHVPMQPVQVTTGWKIHKIHNKFSWWQHLFLGNVTLNDTHIISLPI